MQNTCWMEGWKKYTTFGIMECWNNGMLDYWDGFWVLKDFCFLFAPCTMILAIWQEVDGIVLD